MWGRGYNYGGQGYHRGRGFTGGRGNFYARGGGRGRSNGRGGRNNRDSRRSGPKFVKDEVIPFAPMTSTIDAEYAKIERRVGGGTRKKKLQMFNDPTNIEQLCMVIGEFYKAAVPAQLHLNTVALAFEYFPQVLKTPMDSQWLTLAQNYGQGIPYHADDFDDCIADFLALYVGNDGVDKQCNYLRSLKTKPFDMKIAMVWLRINTLNGYMVRWPNNHNAPAAPLAEHDCKLIFEGLMLPQWVNDAHKAGIRASDPAIQMPRVIAFFQTCMDQKNEEVQRRDRSSSSNRGSSRGRGYRNDRRYSPYNPSYNGGGYYSNQDGGVPPGYPPRNPQGQFAPRGGRGHYRGGYNGGRGRGPPPPANAGQVYHAETPQDNGASAENAADHFYDYDYVPQDTTNDPNVASIPQAQQSDEYMYDQGYNANEQFYPQDQYYGDY